MAKNKKNIKLLLPAEEDFNEKIPPNLFKIFEDERDKELPIVELSQFSNNIFLKLFQKCVNLKINKSETSVIIAIDCCRTIIKYIKLINVIFACGIANCLDSLEIPYSIVVFADYKFQYVIKDFNEPHSNEILQRILDCVLVSRYLTRIADACWFIKKKVECQGREKRAICLISNGLDPKLKIPEKWLPIFDNRDNECFNFFFINSLNEKDNIEYNEIIEIWKNFSSITGVEILDIKIEDIIKENLDYIANSFSKMFTKFKFSEAMNIKNKIYNPILLESYVINNEIEEKLISMLKSNINYKNIYIQNKPHINSKTKKIEDLKVPSNFMIQKVDIKYEIKENKLSHIFTSDIKDNKINLLDTIFPPNKATMYAPSTKGSRLYIKGLIYFILTNGQENKIWLEKKAGLKRDYRISIIIDSSRSCFNELMGIHSYQMIVEILSIFSYIQIPHLDIIIERENEPLVLCLGQDSLNSLTINSPIWLALFEILGNPENNCNLKDCVDNLIKLRLLNASKKHFAFILTDGLMNEKEQILIKDKISYAEEFDINLFGIGLGFYPKEIKEIFSKCLWTLSSKLIWNSIISILDNEIQENNEFDEINFSQKENKIKIIKKIEEKWEDVCRYKALYNKLKNCPLHLETMEEIANPEEVNEFSKNNPELTKDNTMCQPGSFKNFKILVACFWSKSIAGENESPWIDPKYLIQRFNKDKKCLREAFEYYGIEMEVETDYEHSILKLQTGNYYACWVICGDGSKYLPNGGNYNLVGQFILCLKTFWKNGGALVFWCDNEPLNYQANLFLETVEFPGGKNVNHIKFEGNHKGEQIMIPGNINIEKKGVFNNKRKFSDGKTERFSLAHNLVNIYEGKTISYEILLLMVVFLNSLTN